jgi:hypothetical protein
MIFTASNFKASVGDALSTATFLSKIRRTRIWTRTLTIKIEQQNLDSIICKWYGWIRIEKHFLIMLISYNDTNNLYIFEVILGQTKSTKKEGVLFFETEGVSNYRLEFQPPKKIDSEVYVRPVKCKHYCMLWWAKPKYISEYFCAFNPKLCTGKTQNNLNIDRYL